MKMKEMSEAERPRERMSSYGPGSLTVGELLAVLIASGTSEKSALDIAREILSGVDWSLARLFSMSFEDLTAFKGIGPKKAATLLAALEIGRRFFEEKSKPDGLPVTSPRMVYDIFASKLKGLTHEECWALFLNNAGRIVAKERMTSGSSEATIISPNEITRMALDKRAKSVVLVHNHPSGNPSPSRADIHQTELLNKALKAFSIEILDHVIFCDNCFYSFSEEKQFRVECGLE